MPRVLRDGVGLPWRLWGLASSSSQLCRPLALKIDIFQLFLHVQNNPAKVHMELF